MTRREFLAGSALFAMAVVVLTGCTLASETLRYRVTVEVDTPLGIRSGSSVWEVSTSEGLAFPGPEAGSLASDVRGDAVAVDLPGGTLFALLRGAGGGVDYPVYLVQRHLAKYPDPRIELIPQDWAENRRRIQQSGVKFELAADEYPMLVRFRSLSAPTTVEKVQPGSLPEHFAGVRLLRITVEMTHDPVTTGIEGRLPWLNTSVTGYLDGQFTGGGPGLANILDTTAFKGAAGM